MDSPISSYKPLRGNPQGVPYGTSLFNPSLALLATGEQSSLMQASGDSAGLKEVSDEGLAKSVQDGDKAAFGDLVDRYEAKLTRYARKFLANRDDVKDLVQDVFVKAFCNIKSFDISRRFSPWIYRIAHNEFVNELERKRRDRLTFLDFDTILPHPAAKETSDSEAIRKDLRRSLDIYLNQLDAKYREPLVLYYFQELEYKEIADILRIPVATVGVRLQRGRAMLRKIIDKDNEHGKK